MLVYLDLNYWRRLVLPEFANLAALLLSLAEERRVVFPVSAVHFIETMKLGPEIRAPIFDLMIRLSRGTCLINPISAMQLEFDRSRYGHELSWMRSGLLTTNPFAMLGPARSIVWRAISALMARRVDLKLFLSLANELSGSKATTKQLNAVFEEGARNVNSIKGLIRVQRSDVAKTLGVSNDELPLTESDLLQAFPSLLVRTSVSRAIVEARPSGLEPNDIPDLGFIPTVVPYFDLVAVDHKMGHRIREASSSWRFPFHVLSDINRLAAVVTAAR